jgi:hypothetical protein
LEDSNGHSTVVKYSDPNGARDTEWQAFRINLRDFNNVNLSRIKKLCIGFGDKLNPQYGGSGTVHFDDIAVFPPRCFGRLAGDINGDCKVDFNDFADFSEGWVAEGTIWP